MRSWEKKGKSREKITKWSNYDSNTNTEYSHITPYKNQITCHIQKVVWNNTSGGGIKGEKQSGEKH